MPKTMIDMGDFHARATGGERPKMAVRFAVAGDVSVAAEDRTLSFVFSDGSTDRYGDQIDARGWVLDNFKANPIALFGHDASSIENVVGSAKNVRVEGTRLVGDIQFATAEESATADTVYRLAMAGHLRTVSVGFQPIEWSQTKDKSRPGGIDFKKQELLEISIVPIPANPNALVQARAAGIDVDRLALIEGAQPDMEIVTPVPARAVGRVVTKGLYDVSDFAYFIQILAYLASASAWEAECEGDGSDVPGRLADLLKTAGQILVDMTAEEVGELIANVAPPVADGETVEMAFARGVAPTAARRELGVLVRSLNDDTAQALAFALKQIAGGRTVVLLDKGVEVPLTRSGKVLSSENEQTLRDAHAKMTEACDMVMGVCGKNTPADAQGEADEAKAARVRRAEALRRKNGPGA